MDRAITLFVTYFGVGKLPKAPGTFGTLGAVPLVFFLSYLNPFVYMTTTFLLAIIAIFICDLYEKKKGGHDHQEVVIDEVVGYLITMTWLPQTWQAYLAGFILFRVLDILKPFPIGRLDARVPGGLGVMADDIAAGIIASIILQMVYTKTSWLGVTLI